MKELIKTFLAGLGVTIPLAVAVVLFNLYPQVMNIVALCFFGGIVTLFIGLIVRDIFDDY